MKVINQELIEISQDTIHFLHVLMVYREINPRIKKSHVYANRNQEERLLVFHSRSINIYNTFLLLSLPAELQEYR